MAKVKDYISAAPKELNRLAELDFEKESGLYAGLDTYYTRKLYKKQRRAITMGGMIQANKLLHEGSIALAHMEHEGIRVDVSLMKSLHTKWTKEFERHKNDLLTSDEARDFKRREGRSINFNKQTSREDLKTILFDILELDPISKTKKTGTSAVDEKTLLYYEDVSKFITSELNARKYLKRIGSLENFMRYEVDGFLYPSFHLDVARSYRSSSSEPNFQNIIKHDEEGAVIRMCIIPRKGNCLYEVDYGSQEVRVLACWSKDDKLIQFILDDFDMHAYWAEQIFNVEKGGTKAKKFKVFRYTAKNQFVFPLFYGSYWKTIAANIYDLFEDIGYSYKGTYAKWETHIRCCEDKFWHMFSGVRDRQLEAVEEYKRTGYIKMIGWGFERHGYMSRNVIFNSHIQGPAFHCLLWSIIQRDKERDKFETKMCGQIHDAIYFDGPPSEERIHTERVSEIMADDIRKDQPWIIVPLVTEWEKGKENWLEKSDTNPGGMTDFTI